MKRRTVFFLVGFIILISYFQNTHAEGYKFNVRNMSSQQISFSLNNGNYISIAPNESKSLPFIMGASPAPGQLSIGENIVFYYPMMSGPSASVSTQIPVSTTYGTKDFNAFFYDSSENQLKLAY